MSHTDCNLLSSGGQAEFGLMRNWDPVRMRVCVKLALGLDVMLKALKSESLA